MPTRGCGGALVACPKSPISLSLDHPGSVYIKPQSKHGAALTAAELARGRTYPWAARLCGASNVTAVEGAVQLIDWMAAAGVRPCPCSHR